MTPLFNHALRTMTCAAALSASLSAQAFMPVTGAWQINTEATGAPGRGFQLEVQNEIVVLSYFGYRADGSPTFLTAVGPIVNNVFTAKLNEYAGGTAVGAAYKAATVTNASPGNITLSFSSGLKGTMTLPGEPPKAISKINYGYPATIDGLMGTYAFNYTVAPAANGGSTSGSFYTINTVTSVVSSGGSGLATNYNGTFGCEHITSGTLQGAILCAEKTGSQNDDAYMFKMSGERGSGVGAWTAATAVFAVEVVRTANKSGVKTGNNDSTQASLAVADAQDDTPLALAKLAQDRTSLKQQLNQFGIPSTIHPHEREAMVDWLNEVRPRMGR